MKINNIYIINFLLTFINLCIIIIIYNIKKKKELFSDIKNFDITKYVDKIYYINLEKRKDRKIHVEKQIKKYLDPELKITKRFNAIPQYNGALGCSMSFKGVIEDAIKNKYKRVLIFEDDFEFLISKDKLFKYLELFYNKHINNFDILLLAYNYPEFDKPVLENNKDFLIVNKSLSISGILINNNTFEKFKNASIRSINGFKKLEDKYWKKLQEKHALDVEWWDIFKEKKVYVFPEKIGKQINSRSDIEK